jgi:hypothetical protein
VADKRDEAARMVQYKPNPHKPTPQQLRKLPADLSDDGVALVLFWQGM